MVYFCINQKDGDKDFAVEKKLKYLTGIILGIGYHKPLIKWLKEEAKYIVGKKWP